ncbi:MAG: GNAT family N-acetyltransferase [Planctomycetota bacterium]
MQDVTVRMLTTPAERSHACARIIEALPDWLGQPDANRAYIAAVANCETFGAEHAGEIVGALALRSFFTHTADIYWLGILPDYHRCRIGTHLVTGAIEHATCAGHRWMVVETLSPRSADEHYARTRRFYEAMGFEPLLEHRADDPVNPMMWMIKPLSQIW